LRHTESENAAARAGGAGADANEHACDAGFHQFEGDLVGNRVADDHGNLQALDELLEFKRLVLR
jgi:hypothetical protein